MIAFAAAVAAAAVVGGVLLLGVGLRPVPPAAARPARRRRTPRGATKLWTQASRRQRYAAVASLAAGVVVAIWTGWIIAVLLLPLAAVGIPYLLSVPGGVSGIDRLEAMEEWCRSLAGVLTVGYGLEQALIATLRSTPAAIHPEVSLLVARLRSRWDTRAALRAFADDLDDPVGDLIAANLYLGAQKRGEGLASVLESLAASVADTVRTRREVEADRAKPRTTARWVTLITIGSLALLALNGEYIAPYRTPVGTLILLLLLSMYVGALLWMRQMTKEDKPARFVGASVAQRAGEGTPVGTQP